MQKTDGYRNLLNNKCLQLAPHRVLKLKNSDFAVLSEQGCGWCIVQKTEYNSIVEYLSNNPRTIGSVDSSSQRILHILWNAGLLLADGKPHPDTKRVYEKYPGTLILKLTGACNLVCKYCYDFDVKRSKMTLDFERACETISFLLSKRDSITIAFHGGEPLLRFELLKKIVLFTLSIAKEPSKIKFMIQTNGTLFTDEVVSFLEAYNFVVGISLDGGNEKSNKLRLTKNNVSLLSLIKKLISAYPTFVSEKCGFLAVATRTSFKDIPNFALWLQDQNIKGMSITFMDAVGRAKDLESEQLSTEEAVQLYQTIFSLIRNKDIEQLSIRDIIGRMNNLFVLQPYDMCFKGPCGASDGLLTLDTEGCLRSCDCIYDPFFFLSSKEQSIESIVNNPSRLNVRERYLSLRNETFECSSCHLIGLCGGTCVGRAIAKNGTPISIDPVGCTLSKYIYHEYLQEFAEDGVQPLFDYYRRHKQLN